MWTEELYNIYENCYGKEGFDILPIFHTSVEAKIEITINEDGELINATTIKRVKGESNTSETIVPAALASRSSEVAPFALNDSLKYLAKTDEIKYYEKYIENLEIWESSEYSHPALTAVLTYIKKGTIIEDLEKHNIVIKRKSLSSYIVRFRINYKDFSRESRTWLDKDLINSFIAYQESLIDKDNRNNLCYISGRNCKITYKHPNKIIKVSANSKLISSNNDTILPNVGRFSNKEETFAVGEEYSYKMHNALKWLIKESSFCLDDKKNTKEMRIITWASSMKEIPDVRNSYPDPFFEEDTVSIESEYNRLLKKSIFGCKDNFDINTKVMVMGIRVIDKGVLSMPIYTELDGSKYLENIEKWHREISVFKYNKNTGKYGIGSYGLLDIVNCYYPKNTSIRNNIILQLLPCIIQGKRLPRNIMIQLFRRASNPLLSVDDSKEDDSKNKNLSDSKRKILFHRKALEVACGIIRKYNIENGKGVISLGYDPKETDRSYLYGCLLAIADKTERDTYEKDEQDRTTNARRYWTMFAQRPYQTWKIIEERLNPYLAKSIGGGSLFMKRVGEITEKMSLENFKNNSPLEPSYLLGFHHYNSYMYTSRKKEDLNKED